MSSLSFRATLAGTGPVNQLVDIVRIFAVSVDQMVA
jgi:hypothetical protein